MPTQYMKRLQSAQKKWSKTNGAIVDRAFLCLDNYAKMKGYPNSTHHHVGSVKIALSTWQNKPATEKSIDSLLLAVAKELQNSKINPVGTFATLVHTIVSEAKLQPITVKQLEKQLKSGASMSTIRAIKELKRYSANGFLRFFRGELKNDHVGVVRKVLKGFDANKDVKDLIAALNKALKEKGVTVTGTSPLKKILGTFSKVGEPKLAAQVSTPEPQPGSSNPPTPQQEQQPTQTSSTASVLHQSGASATQTHSDNQAPSQQPSPTATSTGATANASEAEQLNEWAKVKRAYFEAKRKDSNIVEGDLLQNHQPQFIYHYSILERHYRNAKIEYNAGIKAYTPQIKNHLRRLINYRQHDYIKSLYPANYFIEMVQDISTKVQAEKSLTEGERCTKWAQDREFFKNILDDVNKFFKIRFDLLACIRITIDLINARDEIFDNLSGLANENEGKAFINDLMQPVLEKIERTFQQPASELREKLFQDESFMPQITEEIEELEQNLAQKLAGWCQKEGINLQAHVKQKQQKQQEQQELKEKCEHKFNNLVTYLNRVRSFLYLMPLMDPGADHKGPNEAYTKELAAARDLSKSTPSQALLPKIQDKLKAVGQIKKGLKQTHPNLDNHVKQTYNSITGKNLGRDERHKHLIDVNFKKFREMLAELKSRVTRQEDLEKLKPMLAADGFKKLKGDYIFIIAEVQKNVAATLAL